MGTNAQLRITSCRKGAYITTLGEHKASSFYIIRTGSVLLRRSVKVEGELQEVVLKPGDFFGVVSTMSNHPHIDYAQALEDVTLISVAREQYSYLIENNSAVAMNIINGFSRRVRLLNRALTDKTYHKVVDPTPEHLFSVGEYYARSNRYNEAFYAYYKYVKNCPTGGNVPMAKARLQKLKPYVDMNSIINTGPGDSFVMALEKDKMLFSEGENGSELYIIQKGSIKITKIVNNQEVLLAILKQGDIFGEMALLENKPRSASAIANENVTLMVVSRENFKNMVSAQPQIVTKLTVLLAERIWATFMQIANCSMDDPLGKVYDWLYIELEKANVKVKEGVQYAFNFGPTELTHMIGISDENADAVTSELFKNKKIKLLKDKIYALDVGEIRSQALYYRKMNEIPHRRRKS